MRPPLTIERSTRPNGELLLVLTGTIDERADLAALRDLPEASVVVLDLGGLVRINSIGVREWIRAMKAIPASTQVFWERTSPAMVAQVGMIANFHGHSRVRTFYAPYHCPTCDRDEDVLLSVAGDLAKESVASSPDALSLQVLGRRIPARGDAPPYPPLRCSAAPVRECAECGAPMVFDDIERDYLSALLDLGASEPAGEPDR